METVEIPQLQLVDCGHCRSHARRCATTGAEWFRRPENCEGPAVAVHLNRVVDVPVVAGPAARSSSTTSPHGGYGGGMGILAVFPQFSLSSGLSRS